MTDLPPGLTPLLDREALAKVLGLSPETVKRPASKDPDRLPPRVRALHAPLGPGGCQGVVSGAIGARAAGQ